MLSRSTVKVTPGRGMAVGNGVGVGNSATSTPTQMRSPNSKPVGARIDQKP